MFSVTMRMLACGEENLRTMSGRLNRHAEGLENIAYRLRRISGYEEIAEVLLKEQEELTIKKNQFKRLAQTLEEAGEAYGECERRNLAFENILIKHM